VTVDRARLERHIAELSAIGGAGTSVTRLGLSPDEQRARDLVGSWLQARGATVRRDGAANVYCRFGAAGPAAIVVGSHLDSVPEGGRFDGALGVLCAVEAVEASPASAAAERTMAVRMRRIISVSLVSG